MIFAVLFVGKTSLTPVIFHMIITLFSSIAYIFVIASAIVLRVRVWMKTHDFLYTTLPRLSNTTNRRFYRISG